MLKLQLAYASEHGNYRSSSPSTVLTCIYIIIFHNFLTFPLSKRHTQSGHRRHVNRSHLTQPRWKLLENLQWQERSRVRIFPEVQTHPGAEQPLAGSLLCTIIFWIVGTRDWLAIASEFKTEVLADVVRCYLGTERPDMCCPGANSHHHCWALCSFILLQNVFFFFPALVLDEVHQLHTYMYVAFLVASFEIFWVFEFQ